MIWWQCFILLSGKSYLCLFKGYESLSTQMVFLRFGPCLIGQWWSLIQTSGFIVWITVWINLPQRTFRLCWFYRRLGGEGVGPATLEFGHLLRCVGAHSSLSLQCGIINLKLRNTVLFDHYKASSVRSLLFGRSDHAIANFFKSQLWQSSSGKIYLTGRNKRKNIIGGWKIVSYRQVRRLRTRPDALTGPGWCPGWWCVKYLL